MHMPQQIAYFDLFLLVMNLPKRKIKLWDELSNLIEHCLLNMRIIISLDKIVQLCFLCYPFCWLANQSL